MSNQPNSKRYADIPQYVVRWATIITPVAIAIGAAVALFLIALDAVTALRQANGWLLYLLPLAGAAIGFAYFRWGKSVEAGNLQIIDEIHRPGGGVPSRMAPFVLVGTIITHLFGGSAGREGTAVQIGGSIASSFDRWVLQRLPSQFFHLAHDDRRQLLQAGMAAGFGAVFGTPITGAVFALEVLSVSRIRLTAIIPCLLAAFIGDRTVARLGVLHTQYPHLSLASMGLPPIDSLMLIKVSVAAIAFGISSWLFIACAHGVRATLKRYVAIPWLRPVIGAFIIIALTLAIGSRDYLGLGVTAPAQSVSIVSSFADGGAKPFSWLLKIIFTSVTVGSGFKGGEVTPIFFIGASLGNALAVLLHAPVALFAALGFVAVFAGATNTPIACTIMGLELFGIDAAIYMALACLLAFLASGRRSLYQKIEHEKSPA